MRAATYVGDQTFRIEERDAQAPGAGEVRLDVAYVGICGTDLHILHGEMDARVCTPAVIGHEMSGTVRGRRRRRRRAGRPATRSPSCRSLVRHLPRLPGRSSARLPEPASSASTRPGRCSSAGPCPAPAARPPAAGPRARPRARSSSPSAVAAHDVRRAGVRRGRDACVVVGGGPIGILIAAVARERGSRGAGLRAERAPARGRRARLGLETVDPRGDDVAALVDDVDGRRGRGRRLRGLRQRPGARPRRSHALARARAAGRRRHPRPAAARRPAPLLLARAGRCSARGSTSAPTSSARSRCSRPARSPPTTLITTIVPLDARAGRLRDPGGRRAA